MKEPPIWRDPTYLRDRQRDARVRWIPGALTGFCGLCLFLRGETSYDTAISMQLAAGEPSARLLFVGMFATLLFLVGKFWQWRHIAASLALLAIVAALAIIALTNPNSGAHNHTFIVLSLLVCAGNAGLFYVHMDLRLLACAAGSLFALFLCPFHIGIGERMLIASSCGTLNVLYYAHLDP